jgi:hypothetical protein
MARDVQQTSLYVGRLGISAVIIQISAQICAQIFTSAAKTKLIPTEAAFEHVIMNDLLPGGVPCKTHAPIKYECGFKWVTVQLSSEYVDIGWG